MVGEVAQDRLVPGLSWPLAGDIGEGEQPNSIVGGLRGMALVSSACSPAQRGLKATD